MAKVTKAKVEHALRQTDGKVYLAARALGISFQAVYDYIKRYPELQEVVEQARGELVDVGETMLRKAVLAGEAWAVCFTLKTIGKSRGYIERAEFTGADGEPLVKLVINAGDAGDAGDAADG